MDVKNLPIPAKKALRKLGSDLMNARKRRRIPMQLAADRAGISRSTLAKIEKGDSGVSIAAYAKILFILGLIQRLTDLVDFKYDEIGLVLEEENLPKRVRFSKKEKIK